MSRRIPDCAYCGKTLRKGPVVRMVFESLPGRPEVGWHLGPNDPWRCALNDPTASRLMGGDNRMTVEGNRAVAIVDEAPDLREVEDRIRTIQMRGVRRVSANKSWYEYLIIRGNYTNGRGGN